MKSTVLKVNHGEKLVIEREKDSQTFIGPATLIVLTEEDKADVSGPNPYTELGPGMEVDLQAKAGSTQEEEHLTISEAEMKEAIVRAFMTKYCKPSNTDEAPHPINTSIFHISPTLEDAKVFSQARVQGLLGHEELLKKIEATPIPLRKDGMPDLNDWKGFIEQLGSISLRELILAAKSSRVNFEKMFYLDKAIEYEKYVIATKIVKQFAEEGLSIKDSNEILESIQDMLLNSKVSC